MENIKHYKLKNQLEVIFERIKGVNVVSIFFVIKNGSGSEPEGKEGISHFLEHMIFKGTKKLSATEIIDKIETLGGNINGYTSLDETAFYISIPKRNWKEGFDILFKMVFEINFTEDEFENEKKVVLEELKDGKDNPYKILIDETFSTLFKKHQYKNPVIGYETSVKNLTLDNIIEYYNDIYSPKNIILVVTGDINEKEFIKELNPLKNLKNRKVIKEVKKYEPIQKKHRINIYNLNINQNYLNIAYKLPGKYFKDFATIQILSSILGEFQNSILKQKLKDELQLVTEIGTFIHFGRDYSIFFINAMFPLENSVEDILRIIFNEIEMLKKTVIPPDQILKSIINHKSDKIFSKEYVSGAAKNIMFYHLVTGNYSNENRFLKEIEEINSDKLQKCCSKYLTMDRANIVLLTKKNKSKLNFENIFLNQNNKPKNIRKSRFLIKLDNGIRIIFEKNKRLPIISFQVSGLGGLKFENQKNNGITKLMTKAWIEGSKNHSKREIDEKFDFFSGFINTFSGRNSFGIQSVILKDYFGEAFKIFIDVLKNPLFEDGKLNKTKKNLIEKITALEDDAFNIAIRFFYKTLFKENYYAFPVEGSIKNIEQFGKKEIIEMFNRVVKSENLVFGFTGDFKNVDVDSVCNVLDKIPLEKFNYNFSKHGITNRYEYKEKTINKNQAHIIAGFVAPPVTSEESVVFEVIKAIIGNHSGKLFVNLRENLGLCYSTFAFYMNAFETGAFGIYVSTSPENKILAIDKLIEVIDNLKNDTISNDDIVKAKNYIKGSMDNFYQKYLNINSKNVYNILYNLGENYDKEYLKLLNKVNKKSIENIIDKYFDTKKFVYTVLIPKQL